MQASSLLFFIRPETMKKHKLLVSLILLITLITNNSQFIQEKKTP